MKEKALKAVRSVVTGLSVIGLILSATAGIVTAFYSQLSEVFLQFGWPQERLAWLTVTLTAISTGGFLVTRVLSFINTAISSTQLQANELVQSLRSETAANLVQRDNASKRELDLIKKELREDMAQRKKTNDLLDSINSFNILQAKKISKVPERLVSKELKDEYQNFINKKV